MPSVPSIDENSSALQITQTRKSRVDEIFHSVELKAVKVLFGDLQTDANAKPATSMKRVVDNSTEVAEGQIVGSAGPELHANSSVVHHMAFVGGSCEAQKCPESKLENQKGNCTGNFGDICRYECLDGWIPLGNRSCSQRPNATENSEAVFVGGRCVSQITKEDFPARERDVTYSKRTRYGASEVADCYGNKFPVSSIGDGFCNSGGIKAGPTRILKEMLAKLAGAKHGGIAKIIAKLSELELEASNITVPEEREHSLPNWFCPKFSCDEGDCRVALPHRTCGIRGCRNPRAVNYEPRAHMDAFCIILGCTDSNAVNFMQDATIDDGKCIVYGCTNILSRNYNRSATDDNGDCEITGCMDSAAANYNVNANLDDSCVYDAVYDCYGRMYSHSYIKSKLSNGACDAGGQWGNADPRRDFLGPNLYCPRFSFDSGDCVNFINISRGNALPSPASPEVAFTASSKISMPPIFETKLRFGDSWIFASGCVVASLVLLHMKHIRGPGRGVRQHEKWNTRRFDATLPLLPNLL
jgi:hypothetical protein